MTDKKHTNQQKLTSKLRFARHQSGHWDFRTWERLGWAMLSRPGLPFTWLTSTTSLLHWPRLLALLAFYRVCFFAQLAACCWRAAQLEPFHSCGWVPLWGRLASACSLFRCVSHCLPSWACP